MNFQIIASGSDGNAYILDDGKTKLLIECGGKFKDIQVACNFKISQFVGCLITHEHKDHCKNWQKIQEKNVPIYASEWTLNEMGAAGEILAASKLTEVGSYKILPFPTVHDAQEPLGFLIKSANGGKLVFITDTAFCNYRFKGLTHIAIETNYVQEIINERIANREITEADKARTIGQHMSLDHALRFLERQDIDTVEHIYLLHLSKHNADREQFKTIVERETGKPVSL